MPPHITLVIHSLDGGGAERMAAEMGNHWAAAGDQVRLVTLDSAANDRYPLCDEVDRIGLDVLSHSAHPLAAIYNNLRRIFLLRRAIRDSQPDHVISLVDKMNILTLLSCVGLGLDVVICERIDPRHHPVGLIWSGLRRLTYRYCRALTVQTERVSQYARRFVGKRPVYVIPNPVLVDTLKIKKEALDEQNPSRYVVAMGRLDPQKGFERLIEAFGMIASKHHDWRLRILGEGSQRQRLEQAIGNHGLDGRAELLGWMDQPYDLLRSSHLFVLSSRYEGFPVALLEAMACGLPVISFDCESGPAEIVRHEVDGLLVPPDNVQQLADAMDRLMSDEGERNQLAKRATEVAQRFSQDSFFRRWDAILDGATEEEFNLLA